MSAAENLIESDVSLTTLLTFKLANELFAVSIENVREVLEYTDVTRVPRLPSFFKGVLNLRGHVIPVVDLRDDFGFEAKEPDEDTCIVILEDTFDESHLTFGLLVDAVSEVLEVDENHVSEPPEIGTGVSTDFIDFMIEINNKTAIKLNVSHILTLSQIKDVKKVAKNEMESDDKEEAD